MNMRILLLAAMSAAAFAQQYSAASAGSTPPEVPAPLAALLNKDGIQVKGPDGVFAEVWLVSKPNVSGNSTESNVTLPMIPHGSLMGVIRFPGKGADRRAQSIKAGVYTLRYSNFPINGDHQGVAPQRDFLVMTPMALDTDWKPVADWEALMSMSRKTSGTPHPAVLSFWKQDSDFKPGLHLEGEHDWVWHVKVGDLPLAIILVGKAEG